MMGLSPHNLLYKKQFFEAYSDLAITKQPVAQIPREHNLILMEWWAFNAYKRVLLLFLILLQSGEIFSHDFPSLPTCGYFLC